MSPEPAKAEDIPAVCRREVVEWDHHAKKVAEAVMELLAEGLGLGAGKFKELTFSDARVFVGHCYPYCPQPDLTVGITSHTDPGIVTVLLQNQIQELQVRHGEEWVDVKPLPGGLIFNIGDFLQSLMERVQERTTPRASQLQQRPENLHRHVLQSHQVERVRLLWSLAGAVDAPKTDYLP
ncbi:hypothetical protein Acr_12g0004350 [Actinidia rufa]|uniref:Fe2OG dioxygenase domain-containing protein n=1 Tax=Actinidia rufa TaxID=165716 RepID=A0A7J0FGR5_9ERIC|nr:hypothetical protein Acr_12g0004350 [Actinidia rufa]